MERQKTYSCAWLLTVCFCGGGALAEQTPVADPHHRSFNTDAPRGGRHPIGGRERGRPARHRHGLGAGQRDPCVSEPRRSTRDGTLARRDGG